MATDNAKEATIERGKLKQRLSRRILLRNVPAILFSNILVPGFDGRRILQPAPNSAIGLLIQVCLAKQYEFWVARAHKQISSQKSYTFHRTKSQR